MRRSGGVKPVPVLLVGLLLAVTLGLYCPFWMRSRLEQLGNGESELKNWPWFVLLLIGVLECGAFALYLLVETEAGVLQVDLVNRVLNLLFWVVAVVGCFRIRKLLVMRSEGSFSLGEVEVLWTFLLGPLYLQWKLNQVAKG